MLPRLTATLRNEYILRHGFAPKNAADRYLILAKEGHVFDEGEIVHGMKLMLNHVSRRTTEDDGLHESAMNLVNYLGDHPRPITQAHSDKGIAWWRKNCFCKGGTGRVWRNNEFTKYIGDRERRIIETFTHFLFYGYGERVVNNYGMYHWLPEYSVHGLDEQGHPAEFNYIYGSWQSGQQGLEFV
jgi:hypothetical protein